MILAGEKAGNPWHGTWTEDGLALPNETTMAIPVAVDGGANGWPAFYPIAEPGLTTNGPRHGDCFLVRVPDTPVPETSAAEEAIGMTWTNYTLISGANRLLYGVPIGKACWVYLDSDDRPWLVEILRLLEGTAVWRFRFFSMLTFGENFAEIVEEFTLGLVDDAAFDIEAVVYDASETGRSIAWGFHYYDDGHFVDVFPDRLVLTGTPGVDLDITQDTADTGVINPDLVWGNGEPWAGEEYPAGHWSGTTILLPYWIFDGDDAISLRSIVDYDVDAWSLIENETVHSPRTLEGMISVVTPFGSLDVSFTSTVSEPVYGQFIFSFETDDWSYTYDTRDNGPLSSGFVPYIYGVRQANKVVEVVFSAEGLLPDSMDMEVWSVCRVLPDRFIATGATKVFNEIPAFMTYHPVTKEFLGSEGPVCFM